jgi:2'-5' RNA ligase
MENNPLDRLVKKGRNSIILALAPLEMDPLFQKIGLILANCNCKVLSWHHITLAWYPINHIKPRIEQKLYLVTGQLSPFMVTIEGFHLFAKDKAITLRIKKTPELIHLRRNLRNVFYPFPFRFDFQNWYANWIPHITLAFAQETDQAALVEQLNGISVASTPLKIHKLTVKDLYAYEKVFDFNRHLPS